MKIGIFGGSFDPIHSGHIEVARQAYALLNLDEVWFLPSSKTPLKDRNLTDNEDRKHMIALSIQNIPYFSLCTIEMEREGISYTIDTVLELKRLYPDYDFYWIIGNDQLKRFIVPMLRCGQCVLAGDVKLIKANIMQKHIDTAKVVSRDIDLLSIKAISDGIFTKNLFCFQKQRTRTTRRVIDLVDLGFANRAKSGK